MKVSLATAGRRGHLASSPSSSVSSSSSASSSSSSSSSTRVTMTALLVCLGALMLVGGADGYLGRMMNCQQFCELLGKSKMHQLWCIIQMCHKDKLNNYVIRYAKRSPGDVISADQSESGEGRLAPYRLLREMDGEDVSKRDQEYWAGPAPADINE